MNISRPRAIHIRGTHAVAALELYGKIAPEMTGNSSRGVQGIAAVDHLYPLKPKQPV